MTTMEELKEFIEYDETSKSCLRWKKTASGKAKAGNETGSSRYKGYCVVIFRGKRFSAHRAIWELCNGPIPNGMEIDHISGNRVDNRIANLRLATRSENSQNQPLRRDNVCGVKGVYWHKSAKKWHARISINKKLHSVGYFRNLDDAEMAIKAKRVELHGKFARHA